MTEPTTKPIASRTQGFTLIELMVTVFVLVILTVAALPFYQSFISSQRIKTASFDLMALLTFTRSEAIKRNVIATLNSNGASFDTGSSFLVTAMANVNNTPTLTTLRQAPMFKGIKLACVNTTVTPHVYTSCPASGVVYNNNGRQATSPAFPAIEIFDPATTGNPGANYRCVTIDLSGRPNSAKGKC